MASLGIEAIKLWADEGVKPEPTEGLDFFDTGVNLVTDATGRRRAVDRLGRGPRALLGLIAQPEAAPRGPPSDDRGARGIE